MDLKTLRAFALEALDHPNYQFKDLSMEAIDDRASQSFMRLPEDQKLVIKKSWQKLLDVNSQPLNKETATELLRLRFLCQTNLFFLCFVLEKYGQVTLKTHEDICNKFFVCKDPTFYTFEKFADQYVDLKDRMLLVPRGGFKSSLNIADSVQWIICYPRLTIAILTGRYDLASDFVGELKNHFTMDEVGETLVPKQMMDPETSKWSSSMFQVLFPEHCIGPNTGNMFEFQSPAGGDDKEPTVRATGIEQALAGSHFGIIKLDDVVTDTNSQTPAQLEKISKQISVKRATLHPYGFMDVIGTWYSIQDFYGLSIKQEQDMAKADGLEGCVTGSIESGLYNSRVSMNIYLRSAWRLNEEAVKKGMIEEEAKKEDYILWFPERLSFEVLTKEKRREKFPGEFAIKYLNNPYKANQVKFPRELLVRRTVPPSQIPQQGIIVTTVDTAYSTKSWADYTVILTALIFAGRFHIVNMVRGRFNEYDLPKVIAATANKWKPKRIAIEDSVGVKWMGRELRREMDKLQISVPVEFCSLGLGSKSKSKQLKAKPVLRLLGDERMFFSLSCEGLQEIYAEMEKFTGTSDDAHDDIISAISLLVEIFGGYAENDKRINQVNTDYVTDQKAKSRYDMVFGVGQFAKYNANQYLGDNPTTVFQVENSGQFDNSVDIDPFSDLF